MPAMATFEDSTGYAEPLPVAHRHPGARVARRADKRPAAAFLPESRKKCGHCQDMKPCVEFSADVSRGDGLRGWCKMCEAEARSNRYKKRKAAAIEHSVSRRRLEQPLGGLPSYHSQQQQQPQPQQRAQAPPAGAAQPPALQQVLEMYAQQNPGVALPPHLQQLLQQAQLQQQHAAMLDHQAQAHRQQPRQQQQQQPAMPLALLQQQMAMWQAQKAAAARASAVADAAPAQHRSAFHPVSPSPQGAPLQQPASAAAISAALGGALNGSGMSAALQGRPQQHQQQHQPLALPSGEALAAYLAAEAATGNMNGADGHATAQTLASIVPRLMPGYSAAMVQDQAAAAKAAAAAAVAAAHRPASPATSDSELSAGEILTGMKHHGGGGGGGFSPWGAAGGGLRTASASRVDSQRGDSLPQRREPALWRGSAGSEDSGLVSVAAAAAARPPSELQVPRRSRTRPPGAAAAKPDRAAAADRSAAVDRAVSTAAAAPAPTATQPASPPRQAAGRGADAKQPGVTHFSSQFLALLLTMRAVAFNSNSNSSGQRNT